MAPDLIHVYVDPQHPVDVRGHGRVQKPAPRLRQQRPASDLHAKVVSRFSDVLQIVPFLHDLALPVGDKVLLEHAHAAVPLRPTRPPLPLVYELVQTLPGPVGGVRDQEAKMDLVAGVIEAVDVVEERPYVLNAYTRSSERPDAKRAKRAD